MNLQLAWMNIVDLARDVRGLPAWSTLIYAVLILIGGVVGGITAQSTVSLIAGVTSGGLAGAAGLYMLRAGARPALYVALLVAIALAGFGGNSWLLQQKEFMPRGLIFVLSLIQILLLLPSALLFSTDDEPVVDEAHQAEPTAQKP